MEAQSRKKNKKRRDGRILSPLSRCPFFKKDGEREIFCEGVVERGTVRLGFSYAGHKKRYFEKHCCENFKSCVLFRAVNEKYAVKK